MPRGRSLAITLLMLAVITAAGVAFVFAQEEKQAKAAVRLVAAPALVSPGCRCPYEEAKLKMRLEQAATLGVEIVTAEGELVATVEPGRALPAGRTSFTWDGTDAGGEPAAPGVYGVRMVLVGQDRVYTRDEAIKVVPPRRGRQLPEQDEPAEKPPKEDPPESR